MHRSLLIFLTFWFAPFLGHAQQVSKSGGTSNSTFLLGNVDYARKSQLLYLPSDLTGEQPGTITRIYFKRGSTGASGTQVLTDFTVQLEQTTETGFTSSAFFTGLTTVIDSGSATLPGGNAGTWFGLTLDVPFEYDPTKTLIVEIAFETSTVNNWGTFGTSNTPVKKIISPNTSATTGDGSSSTWQDFGFDLGPVAVAKVQEAPSFHTFPNPATDLITLELPDFMTSSPEFRIFDSIGKEVLSGKPDANGQVPTGNLPSGIYRILLQTKDQKFTSRFVKQ